MGRREVRLADSVYHVTCSAARLLVFFSQRDKIRKKDNNNRCYRIKRIAEAGGDNEKKR